MGTSKEQRFRAADIAQLLAAKHADDVFVTECKDGPSTSGHIKLDAWAMRRSWAHPSFIGYEIKVSRSDFVGDTKWPQYLGVCNEFYFVCPAGIIRSEELSPEAGLLQIVSTGTRLLTKKRLPTGKFSRRLSFCYTFSWLARGL